MFRVGSILSVINKVYYAQSSIFYIRVFFSKNKIFFPLLPMGCAAYVYHFPKVGSDTHLLPLRDFCWKIFSMLQNRKMICANYWLFFAKTSWVLFYVNFLLLVKSAPTKTPRFMSSLKYFDRFVDSISVQVCPICVSKSTSSRSIVLVSFPYPRPSCRSRTALLLWWREKFCAHTLVF